MSVEKNHNIICLIFAAHTQGWNTILNTVFLLKLGVTVKRNVIKVHFYIAFSIYYFTPEE